jgi:hypothetical protein
MRSRSLACDNPFFKGLDARYALLHGRYGDSRSQDAPNAATPADSQM